MSFKNQKISIQLEDIDILEIVHTSEQKLSISMQDYVENPAQLEIENDKDYIRIFSKKMAPFQLETKTDKFCYEQPLFPTYKLVLPERCEVEVVLNNGNVETKKFHGELNIRLNTGDISLSSFTGKMNIELFSGNVNATIEDTEVFVVSNHGRISTSFPSADWQKTDISLQGYLGNDNNLLKVQSINANITLNTIETQ